MSGWQASVDAFSCQISERESREKRREKKIMPAYLQWVLLFGCQSIFPVCDAFNSVQEQQSSCLLFACLIMERRWMEEFQVIGQS